MAGNWSDEKIDKICGNTHSYRRLCSARKFFIKFFQLNLPVIISAIVIVFLAKILWPALIYSLVAIPVWALVTFLWLLFHASEWKLPETLAFAKADASTGNRGLIMALQEAEGPDWQTKLVGENTKLAVSFPLKHTLSLAALTAILIFVAKLPDLRPPAKATIPAPIQRTGNLAAKLKEQGLIDKEQFEKTQELIEKLKKKQQEAGKMAPEDWLALDSAKQELKKQAADALQNKQIEMQETARLLEKLQENAPLPPQDAKALAEQIGNLGKEAFQKMAENKEFMDGLTPEQQQAMKDLAEGKQNDLGYYLEGIKAQCEGNGQNGQPMNLTPEQMQALQAMLEAQQGEPVDIYELAEGMGGEGIDPEDLQAILGACEGGVPGPPIAVPSNEGGRGGVTRGPGEAPLRLSEQTDPKLGKFSGMTFRGKEGEMEVQLGRTTIAPDGPNNETKPAVAGPIRQFSPDKAGLTWNNRIQPRHNAVIKKYFAPNK